MYLRSDINQFILQSTSRQISNCIISVKISLLLTSGKKRDINFRTVVAISKKLFSASVNMFYKKYFCLFLRLSYEILMV